MKIWRLEGQDLQRLLNKVAGDPVPHTVRIGITGDDLQVKDNSYEWSVPLGGVEVDGPENGRHELLFEKCDHCHLFVVINQDAIDEPLAGLSEYMHLHRGDEADERLDESHEARPSGRKANLLTWKTYGPLAMRERFTT